MKRTDRRNALQLAMAAAIIPTLCAKRASAATPGRLIAPPTTPMRYARTITRALADGTPFTVTREFDVSFRRFASGFMLHGSQVEVAVDCPQSLAEFAQLERRRDENSLFPIALDPFGQILSTQIAQPAGQDVRQAVSAALAQLASQPISSNEREQLAQFIAALQDAGRRVTAHLPTDLFAPATDQRRDEQNIALPGGMEGTVETTFECQRDAGTGLMQAANRNVVTKVANSRRGTQESWSLTAI